MRTTIQVRSGPLGEAVFNAPRQLWLAGLGAAVMTRDWAQNEARPVFLRFVKEGTMVESKAIRFFGDRVETSFAKANSVWKSTRANVTTVVREAADNAVALVRQTLPRTLPKFERPVAPQAKAPVRKAKRAAKTAVRKLKRRAKRA